MSESNKIIQGVYLDIIGLPPIEQKLLSILNDGRMHLKTDLIHGSGIKDDGEGSGAKKLKNYLCSLRKKLPKGQDIVPIFRERRVHYMRVIHGPRWNISQK